MIENSRWSQFWDESVTRSGHTGYGEAIMHCYDQPVRMVTVKRIIKKLYPNGLQDHVVLDIGCGTGDFISISLNQGAACVDGVDVSPKVLAKAALRFKGDNRVRLSQGTVIEHVTEQDRYDLITSITVLQHHVDEDELIRALISLRKSMKPNGRMIVLELAPPLYKEDCQQYSRDVLYLVERPPQNWRAAFSAAGLKVINESVMPQLGISCLRGLSWIIRLLLKPDRSTTEGKQPIESTNNVEKRYEHSLKYKRRILRNGLQLARLIILWGCYPLYHWLRLPLPPSRFRKYRVFELGKQDSL